MRRNKVFLILLSAVCVLLAALLGAGAVSICTEGLARQAEDPLASVYTAEIVREKMSAAAPLFIAFLILLAAGLLLGVKDPAAGKPIAQPGQVRQKAEPGNLRRVRAVLAAAAVLFIIAGILNGSAYDVLVKAIHICTECVGLG